MLVVDRPVANRCVKACRIRVNEVLTSAPDSRRRFRMTAWAHRLCADNLRAVHPIDAYSHQLSQQVRRGPWTIRNGARGPTGDLSSIDGVVWTLGLRRNADWLASDGRASIDEVVWIGDPLPRAVPIFRAAAYPRREWTGVVT